MVDVALKDSGIRQTLDLIILAIRKPDDSMVFNPKAETKFEAGDTVVALGRGRSLKEIERLLT